MNLLKRRRLLQTALAASAWTGLTAAKGRGAAAEALDIIDSNVSLFHWPFRRLPDDEPADLVKRLRALGVRQAWAGSFEGLLHRDLATVNERLAAACREHGPGWLRPFGSVNLTLPDWREDLRRCAERHAMPGIRLHPNHHGYTLEHPDFPRLLALAGEAGLLVQLAAATEDTRTQHPQTQTPDVDLKPLPGLLRAHPRTRVQVLNHRPSPALPPALAAAPNVWFDLARTEGTDGVARLAALAGAGRVLFGSHAPFLIPEAALIRVEEGLLAGLDETDAAAVLAGNAAALLPA